MAVFETNTYACGRTVLAAFQMITFPCGGTALAVLTLTLYALRWDGVGGI